MHHAKKQSRESKGAATKGIRDIIVYTSHSGSKMDNFEEDPAADFLAREQDDLAELGEDFGGGGAETNVSLVTPWSDEILETEQADFF